MKGQSPGNGARKDRGHSESVRWKEGRRNLGKKNRQQTDSPGAQDATDLNARPV